MKSIPTPIHSYETPSRSYEIENSTSHPQVIFAIHLFKVNDGNIRTKWKVCLKFHRLFRWWFCSRTWLRNKVETHKDFRLHYFWLHFVYQHFQNGYFRISLFSILLRKEKITSNMFDQMRQYKWMQNFVIKFCEYYCV